VTDETTGDTEFQSAQHEYLRGHWIECETRLLRLLGAHPQDVEARLLLASVRRRTDRWKEARQALQELKRDEAAGRWKLEMEAEESRIDELEHAENQTPNQPEQRKGTSRAA
jgi:cytochrome c-type biogenesis protein CcmH/NrfG